MYFPPSSIFVPLRTRELSAVMESAFTESISTPFFVQVTEGVGTPLTGHLIVMVVLEAAVTLSPMFIVTGPPSPTGISTPDSGTWTAGCSGSKRAEC